MRQFMKSIQNYMLVSEAEAIELGLTHEGTVYGVPAWIKVTPDEVNAIPKAYVLRYWFMFADVALDMIAFMLPEQLEIELPHSVSRRLNTYSLT